MPPVVNVTKTQHQAPGRKEAKKKMQDIILFVINWKEAELERLESLATPLQKVCIFTKFLQPHSRPVLPNSLTPVWCDVSPQEPPGIWGQVLGSCAWESGYVFRPEAESFGFCGLTLVGPPKGAQQYDGGWGGPEPPSPPPTS